MQLHLPITKSPIHYLADSQSLISLSEMRNEISNRNQTTWTNTHARTSPKAFYEPTHNQQIATRAMGEVEALNDFMEHIGNMVELKRDEGTKVARAELKSLFLGHRIGNNSAGSAQIPGSLAGSIAKRRFTGKKRSLSMV